MYCSGDRLLLSSDWESLKSLKVSFLSCSSSRGRPCQKWDWVSHWHVFLLMFDWFDFPSLILNNTRHPFQVKFCCHSLSCMQHANNCRLWIMNNSWQMLLREYRIFPLTLRSKTTLNTNLWLPASKALIITKKKKYLSEQTQRTMINSSSIKKKATLFSIKMLTL